MRFMKPNVQSAIEFAKKAHGDQKYGDNPYRSHLEHVAEVLERFHGDLMKAIEEFRIPYESWI